MSETNLRDVESIRVLKALYARRADEVFRAPSAANAAALVELFTEDGVLDLGPFGRYAGRAALLDACENILPQGTAWSAHHFTNPIVDVHGDSATGKWSFLIFAQPKITPLPPPGIIHGGYDDTYRRVGGAWKIAETVAWYSSPGS